MSRYHFRDATPQQAGTTYMPFDQTQPTRNYTQTRQPDPTYGQYAQTGQPTPTHTPYDQTWQQPSMGQMPSQAQQPSMGQMPSQVQQSAGQMPYSNTQPTIVSAHFNSAYAIITPGPDYPAIRGLVTFADIPGGVMVCADVAGLPPYAPATGNKSPIGPFGFHIHEKGNCEIGNPANPFESAGGHWNPTNQPHGNHAGDFPVLVADNGRARMCFILSRFTVDEILGRSVMIHENPDDYRTQPAGNSGKKIACGSIKPWNSFQQNM